MTAVEAMACGTPTVATTEGGLWEEITWGIVALYANPFDPESFGHALNFILANPQVTRQLAKYGSQKARARFTWTGIAQQLLRVLRGAATGVFRAGEVQKDGRRVATADESEDETLGVG